MEIIRISDEIESENSNGNGKIEENDYFKRRF